MGKIMREYGALEYRESCSDDIKSKTGGPGFRTLTKAKSTDVIFFSWIVYKSKGHRNSISKKSMKDPRFCAMPKDLPFDMKKITSGGFKILVDM